MSEDSSKEEVDLAAIEARLAAITPGPWGYKAGALKHYVFSLDKQEDFGISLQELHWYDGHEVPAASNAQFIANAPTDIAALLARARQQGAKIAELEAVISGLEKDDRKTMKAVNRARKQNRYLIAEVKRLRKVSQAAGQPECTNQEWGDNDPFK